MKTADLTQSHPYTHPNSSCKYAKVILMAIGVFAMLAGTLSLLALAHPNLLRPINAMSSLGKTGGCGAHRGPHQASSDSSSRERAITSI